MELDHKGRKRIESKSADLAVAEQLVTATVVGGHVADHAPAQRVHPAQPVGQAPHESGAGVEEDVGGRPNQSSQSCHDGGGHFVEQAQAQVAEEEGQRVEQDLNQQQGIDEAF